MSKLTEPIMQAVIQILSDGMPAAIAEIAAEYASVDTTNVPLPPIKNYLFGQQKVIADFPAIVVDAGPARLDPERFATTWADYDHTIFVAVIVQSDTAETVSRQLLRYSRAIWQVLFADQIVQPSPGQPEAISLMPMQAGPSPLVPEGNQLQRAYAWMCSAHRYDDLA